MTLAKFISILSATALVAVASASTSAQECSSAKQTFAVQPHVALGAIGDNDIVDTATEAGSFSTLVAAVEAADLVETLRGEGPFTVLAPSDDAFAKLPRQTIEHLLKPENKDQLTAILTYHVVPGRISAKDIVNLSFATTANGQRIDVTTEAGGVMIDGARVVATDIHCSNGVIHVIDSVIMPSTDDIVDTAASAGSFGTLLAAAKAAGLVEALRGDGPLTVFAPTDEAFTKLPAGTVESLLKPENKDQLATILTYHVVSGRVYADQALKLGHAATLQGEQVRIRIRNNKPMVNNASLLATDIEASNGVIHVIDTVLLPEGKGTGSSESSRHPQVSGLVMGPGSAVEQWDVVVDGVMGGRSTGFIKRSERGALQFAGNLSLANNGGFSQIRRSVSGEEFEGAQGIEITVRGDGRVYNFDVRSANAPVRVGSYQKDFTTSENEWETYRLPFSEFNLYSYGRRISGAPAIDPAKIESIGFTISDKREGDFQLQIASIRAFDKKNDYTQPVNALNGKRNTDTTSAESYAQAIGLIELAINRGVPLFNDGHAAACAAVYELTIEALIRLGADDLGEATLDRLETGVRSAMGHSVATERAWAYRQILDDAYARLSTRQRDEQ